MSLSDHRGPCGENCPHCMSTAEIRVIEVPAVLEVRVPVAETDPALPTHTLGAGDRVPGAGEAGWVRHAPLLVVLAILFLPAFAAWLLFCLYRQG